jgi:hypothetical protein
MPRNLGVFSLFTFFIRSMGKNSVKSVNHTPYSWAFFLANRMRTEIFSSRIFYTCRNLAIAHFFCSCVGDIRYAMKKQHWCWLCGFRKRILLIKPYILQYDMFFLFIGYSISYVNPILHGRNMMEVIVWGFNLAKAE